MGLVGVAFVTIPMGVLGSGFEDWLGGDEDEEEEENEDGAALTEMTPESLRLKRIHYCRMKF